MVMQALYDDIEKQVRNPLRRLNLGIGTKNGVNLLADGTITSAMVVNC